MREEMKHCLVRTPLALIHVIYVLGNSRQIHDAEERAARGETVRSGLADIIEPGPYKLTHYEVVLLNVAHCALMSRTPWHMIVVIAAAFHHFAMERFVPTLRPYIH